MKNLLFASLVAVGLLAIVWAPAIAQGVQRQDPYAQGQRDAQKKVDKISELRSYCQGYLSVNPYGPLPEQCLSLPEYRPVVNEYAPVYPYGRYSPWGGRFGIVIRGHFGGGRHR